MYRNLRFLFQSDCPIASSFPSNCFFTPFHNSSPILPNISFQSCFSFPLSLLGPHSSLTLESCLILPIPLYFHTTEAVPVLSFSFKCLSYLLPWSLPSSPNFSCTEFPNKFISIGFPLQCLEHKKSWSRYYRIGQVMSKVFTMRKSMLGHQNTDRRRSIDTSRNCIMKIQ